MVGMAHAQLHHESRPAIGPLLQYWRRARNLSQLALAHEANVSPRHVCFLETGRAKPSRDMVLLLADTLAVPLRERNAFLLAAGFAPMFRESTLDDPELAPARTAIHAILKQQEPYPAVVMNRHWDIVATNGAASRFFGMLLGDRTRPGAGNVLRLMFHPDGLRPFVENWEAVAQALVRRVHREAIGGALDEAGRQLLSEILAYPGVPARWRSPDLGAPVVPVVPVSFRHGQRAFHFFSAVTVLGTPQDITLQELRIECFFPLDEASAAAARSLVGPETAG
jgi:transcriptional regulator with XRE-family HTH domain